MNTIGNLGRWYDYVSYPETGLAKTGAAATTRRPGRPSMGSEAHTVVMSVAVSQDQMAKIERLCGNGSRSSWVRNAIIKQLEEERKEQ